MKMLCVTLMGVVALLMVGDLALAGPPSWDDQINKPSRFKVLKEFGDAAVLDKETGLVWEQSPNTNTPFTNTLDWFNALGHCYVLEVGGRKGWRLPTIEELTSLVDTSNSSPALPTGHPFSLTRAQQDGFCWSATTRATLASTAWGVNLVSGDVVVAGKTATLHVWCVRGGQGIHGVQ